LLGSTAHEDRVDVVRVDRPRDSSASDAVESERLEGGGRAAGHDRRDRGSDIPEISADPVPVDVVRPGLEVEGSGRTPPRDGVKLSVRAALKHVRP
jgi:hypothetical protein